ncbi:MAG: ABC transporter substrate-binding protein [Gemmataceae bacterium]|nr:ABC transporter substrate-binding protein [Gemmataceae bacterium]
MNLRAVALSLTLAACGCGRSTPPAIFLGQVTLSAPRGAALGNSAERGVELALKDLGPALSDSLGRRALVVRQLEVHDLDSLEGSAARLASVNRVAALLGGDTLEQALRLEKARVPVLAPIGERPAAPSDLLFTTGLASATQARVLAEFLAEKAPKAGVLVVDSRRGDAEALAAAFRTAWSTAWTQRHHQLPAPEWKLINVPSDGDILEKWATNLVNGVPAAVVFAGATSELERVGAAWGERAPLLALLNLEQEWPRLRPGPAVHFATLAAVGDSETQLETFVAKYRDAYHSLPDLAAILAYDNLRLAAEALSKASSDFPGKLREALRQIKEFPGLTGPLSFTSQQHLQRPVFVARLDAGRGLPVVVRRYDP